MGRTFHEPLSYLDASFLALETRTSHMHVAAVVLFEAGELSKPDGGIDIERVKAHIASKLQYIPRYRQRLAFVPVSRHPVWIDDDDFNFDFHVRHTSLPRPGTDEQLKSLAGRIVSQQLERTKPLWELWIVEGLNDGRFAIIAKIHHCMIDGMAGVDLTTILLDVAPTSQIEHPDDWKARPAPDGTEMTIAELARTAGGIVEGVTSATELVRSGKDAFGWMARRALAVTNSLRSGWLSTADPTPLNAPIGPNRTFDWRVMQFSRVKAIKAAVGGSVNDIVLAVVAGAIRHYLMVDHEFATDDLEFRVMAPVSVRKPAQRGSLGNQVAMWLVTLPVGEADPVRRLRIIEAETRHLKKTDQALGAATLVDLSRGTPIPLLSLASRMAGNALRPFNMTVTNVPGPQFPMYLLEAKMTANFPIVPLWAQHGAGIALFSYDGNLLWGLQTDYDTVPDTAAFLDAIEQSFKLLENAAGVGAAPGGSAA